MTRAMWKADLRLEDLRVPVKLYAAVEDRKVHFRLLHAKDNAPVVQQMVDPIANEPVAQQDIRRAVQIERGVYVVLTPEEQAAIEPKPSRDIAVERVVDAAKLDERWFDRPYYLGPDGPYDEYFALAQALESRRQIGIAHWVMRKKRYTGALYARGGYLLLDTLRYTQQVELSEALRTSAGRAPDAREVKLAEQLIAALEDDFDAGEYRDEHREKVLELIEAKAEGKVVKAPRTRAPKVSDSLVAALQASLKNGPRASHGGR